MPSVAVNAIAAQTTTSTTLNGHAPARNPWALERRQPPANTSTKPSMASLQRVHEHHEGDRCRAEDGEHAALGENESERCLPGWVTGDDQPKLIALLDDLKVEKRAASALSRSKVASALREHRRRAEDVRHALGHLCPRGSRRDDPGARS